MNINRLFKIVTVIFITSAVLALVFGVIALISDYNKKNKGDDGKQAVVKEETEKSPSSGNDGKQKGSDDRSTGVDESLNTAASGEKKDAADKDDAQTDKETDAVKTGTDQNQDDNDTVKQEEPDAGTSAQTAAFTDDGLPIGNSVPKEDLKFDGTETHFVLQNIETSVNVRKEASSSSDKVGVLLKGSYGIVTEAGEDFSKIICGDVAGYIRNTYLMTGRAADEQIQGVSARRVRIDRAVFIRDDANMESNKLAIAAEGAVYSVDPTAPEVHGWVAIVYNDAPKAYVSASFCTVE